MSCDDFWRTRKVLVTGHTGFKGSWLCLLLHRLGAEVHGYALSPDQVPCLFGVAGISDLVQSRIGDINDAQALQETFDIARPEVVLHLAAESLVLRSLEDPVATFATNVMGTVNVLEAARACDSVKAIVIVTSDKVYRQKPGVVRFSETDELGGADPYSASKAGAEIAVTAYRESYLGQGAARTGVATARSGNVIGGGDWARYRIVPDLVRSVVGDHVLQLRRPASVLPWQYVLDALAGYLRLARGLYQNPDRYSGAWNFGPSDDGACNVSQLVDLFACSWGAPVQWQVAPGRHSDPGPSDLKLDTSKSERVLGHRAAVSLQAAVDDTVRWYKAFYNGRAARALSLQQIDDHLALGAADRTSR